MVKGEEFNHKNVIAELYCTGNCATEIITPVGMLKVPFNILFCT